MMEGCSLTKNLSFDATEEYEFCDRTQRLIVAVIFTVLSILGACGNALVILAVILSRKLRSTTNMFVTNLSVADLITCVMFSGHAVAMASPLGWPLPDWICSVISAFTIICLGCSIFNMGFIALNRALLITKPIATYRNVYSKCRLLTMIVCSWLIPAIVTLLPPIFGMVGIGYDNKHKVCTTDHSNPNSNLYDIILAAVYYPVPFLILSTSYLKIYLYVRQHVKRTNLSLSTSGTPGGTPNGTLRSESATPPNTLSFSSRSVTHKRKIQWGTFAIRNQSAAKKNSVQVEITKNTFIVVCAFVVLTTPFTFCVLIDYCDIILPYLGILLLISSCVNPLIYATRHPLFKRVFKCILSCRLRDIPNPPDWIRKSRASKTTQNSVGSTDDNIK